MPSPELKPEFPNAMIVALTAQHKTPRLLDVN